MAAGSSLGSRTRIQAAASVTVGDELNGRTSADDWTSAESQDDGASELELWSGCAKLRRREQHGTAQTHPTP
jgi:hypothetical protein